jgi:hypothetical protein
LLTMRNTCDYSCGPLPSFVRLCVDVVAMRLLATSLATRRRCDDHGPHAR